MTPALSRIGADAVRLCNQGKIRRFEVVMPHHRELRNGSGGQACGARLLVEACLAAGGGDVSSQLGPSLGGRWTSFSLRRHRYTLANISKSRATHAPTLPLNCPSTPPGSEASVTGRSQPAAPDSQRRLDDWRPRAAPENFCENGNGRAHTTGYPRGR